MAAGGRVVVANACHRGKNSVPGAVLEGLTILVVDDHPALILGLQAQLTGAGCVEVIQCSDYRKVSAILEAQTPDAVLFDLHMPQFNLERDFRNIRKKQPGTIFIAYTGDDDLATVERCRSIGFSGYIIKTATQEHLTQTIKAIIDGHSIFPTGGTSPRTESPLTGLQLNILRLVSQGYKNSEIAEALCVTESNIDYHKRNIKKILHASTSSEAVSMAFTGKWI